MDDTDRRIAELEAGLALAERRIEEAEGAIEAMLELLVARVHSARLFDERVLPVSLSLWNATWESACADLGLRRLKDGFQGLDDHTSPHAAGVAEVTLRLEQALNHAADPRWRGILQNDGSPDPAG